MPSPAAAHWTLDPDVTFLNHGSFGACPKVVLEHQSALRAELERQPLEFLGRRIFGLIDAAREPLAAFLGASPEDLVPVTNATAGVNTVLRSLEFSPGDELLTTDHAYNACKNALDYVAEKAGARVVVARVPFPVASEDDLILPILEAVTPATRLALLDHVTSPTGLVFPMARLVDELRARGVETLVDGAHAPGMVELDLDRLGAAYYTGNAHKWLCAPKGTAFLHVRRDRQAGLVPLVISHGANVRRPGRSAFHDQFDWGGTLDPTGWLCLPVALEFLGNLLPGGWPALRERNRNLALFARRLLTGTLGIAAPSPESTIGALAAVPLGEAPTGASPFGGDELQVRLWQDHRIEVPIFHWPAPGHRVLRVSAQMHNDEDDYRRLVAALRALGIART